MSFIEVILMKLKKEHAKSEVTIETEAETAVRQALWRD